MRDPGVDVGDDADVDHEYDMTMTPKPRAFTGSVHPTVSAALTTSGSGEALGGCFADRVSHSCLGV